jgi:cytochrome oxidase Cu insertion factor (SCO1/SenC/PrrC family)
MNSVWKWLGTAICVLLLFVDATMTRNFRGLGTVKSDVSSAAGQIGGHLPDFTLPDIDGKQVTLGQLFGRGPVLLTFDRSLDW